MIGSPAAASMERIRLICFPDCKMVTSGVGFFGDDNFTRFEKLLAKESGKSHTGCAWLPPDGLLYTRKEEKQ